jgi:hypothetical protein
MLRRGGVATSEAARDSAGQAPAMARSFSIADRRVSAPRVRPCAASIERCASAATPRRPTTMPGVCCRRFMFGNRSVPPASTAASGPASASTAAASSSEAGAR